MSKPVAAVRLEGTLTDNADPDLIYFGDLKPGVREKLASLEDTYTIIVVSAACKYDSGARRLWNFLIDSDLAFTDVWCGSGLPSADVWVDDTAVKL